MTSLTANPLSRHFRQPKIFIRLPSRGNFYSKGSLEITETGEFPVLAMTAKDELMFKTPDALLNGQSTVNVIQSCVPNIKNAWAIPSIDVDAILIAIRIATYGEKMDITVKVPEINEERTYAVDLRILLDQLVEEDYNNIVSVGDFKFEIAPMTYKNFTEIALKTFEEQRIFKIVNNDELTETEKLQKFNESFTRITDLNISNILKSVVAVQFANDTPVVNREHIVEFFENADKDIYKALITHIDGERSKFTVKPLRIKLTEEDIARGAPEEMEIPIVFDQANFFA